MTRPPLDPKPMFLRKTILPLMVMAASHCNGNDTLPSRDTSTVTITIQNASDKLSKIDSVFLIFDRYDLRGAGVIRKVFTVYFSPSQTKIIKSSCGCRSLHYFNWVWPVCPPIILIHPTLPF